jgi:hypothetical protein
MNESAYEPREYKSLVSACRAGKRECMKRGIIAYHVYALWAYILVVGSEEHAKWEAYVKEHEFPIMRGEGHTFYVWHARKQGVGQSNNASTRLAETCAHPYSDELIDGTCSICGLPKPASG